MKKRNFINSVIYAPFRLIDKVPYCIARLINYKKGDSLWTILWKILSSLIKLLCILFMIAVVYAFIQKIHYKYIYPYTSDIIYEETFLSNRISVQDTYYNSKFRIFDKLNNKVIMNDVDWVCTSDNNDSLTVFSKDDKRGYINRYTGEVALPAIYSRAWIFSEGIAAVESDGRIFFINHKGDVVIDKNFKTQHMRYHTGYIFHNGYCTMFNADGKVGLIDKKGNWALEPVYDKISYDHKFWEIQKDSLYGLLSEKLDVVFPVEHKQINITENAIEVFYSDNTAKRYDHDGTVVVDFVIHSVENMSYETTLLQSITETDDTACISHHGPAPIFGVAECQKYGVTSNHGTFYGLLNRNGECVTPPSYSYIHAIGEDLYLCQPHGIIINGKGQRTI